MIIYEINLTINNEIYAEYYEWLIDHIKLILKFPGFQQAEIAKERKSSAEENQQTKLTIRYVVDTEKNLDEYLTHYAPDLREIDIKKFGKQFSAIRRVFTEVNVL